MAPPSILLVLRQHADWTALAAACDDGRDIPPASYMPRENLPFFPEFLPDCIALWNRIFAVNFFACRAVLQQIARTTWENVAQSRVAVREEALRHLPEGDFRLFFLDDDDWFAPDAAERMRCAGDEDVAVFPLFRLDTPPFTFVRGQSAAGQIIGQPRPFTFRYQTNNYGLHRRLTTPAMLNMLADHINASETADRIGLRDAYHDVILSATNKTPVSVSVLMRIVTEREAFRGHVEYFIKTLRELNLPASASWMAGPVRRTVELFERVLS